MLYFYAGIQNTYMSKFVLVSWFQYSCQKTVLRYLFSMPEESCLFHSNSTSDVWLQFYFNYIRLSSCPSQDIQQLEVWEITCIFKTVYWSNRILWERVLMLNLLKVSRSPWNLYLIIYIFKHNAIIFIYLLLRDSERWITAFAMRWHNKELNQIESKIR